MVPNISKPPTRVFTELAKSILLTPVLRDIVFFEARSGQGIFSVFAVPKHLPDANPMVLEYAHYYIYPLKMAQWYR